jgi:hypothetical protein
MTILQFHDIPRLANDTGGPLGEILAIVACAVAAGLIFWVLRLDKQKEDMLKYQQENDKATLSALTSVTAILDNVKGYLPEMKGDIKEEIGVNGKIISVQIELMKSKMEHTKDEIKSHIDKRNGI